MKRTAKIAFPEIIFVDSLSYIIPKFYKYTAEKDAKKLASKLHSLYTQKTLTECKETLKNFSEIYNNAIHQKLIQKYLGNIENLYKYSQNIRLLLFKHSANMEFYDKIRLLFNSNNSYILEIEEIYDKLGELKKYFGFTSFKKKEWTLILNDLIQSPKKEAKNIIADYKKIYTSVSLDEANIELEEFKKKYDKHTKIVKKVENFILKN